MMKKTLTIVGIIVTIISIIIGLKSWYDLQECKDGTNYLQTINNDLTIELNEIKSECGKIVIENKKSKKELDSLSIAIKELNENYNRNLLLTNSLRNTRDVLKNVLDSLTSIIAIDSGLISILKDSLDQLNDSIITLQEQNEGLWHTVDSLIRVTASIDSNLTYKEKYLSLLTVIDSFFIPFRVENIKITPIIERKKGVFVPSIARNGVYDRDDFTKIEFAINTKLSDVFLLNLPDSILVKKKEAQKVYVNYYSVPKFIGIMPSQTVIMGKKINYMRLIELDLSLGYICFTVDNPVIGKKGKKEYIFEFYSIYSFEPFYKYSFKTE